jgi:division protein CdvB (Snf7/Vps24/ESCRT-III family)
MSLGTIQDVASLEMMPDNFETQNFTEMGHFKDLNLEGRMLFR